MQAGGEQAVPGSVHPGGSAALLHWLHSWMPSAAQDAELGRRYSLLFLYLLRDPFYSALMQCALPSMATPKTYMNVLQSWHRFGCADINPECGCQKCV